MANGPDNVDKPNSEIDIDNIEVEILILAKSADKLKNTAAFLSRRGWPTQAMSDVQKAIAYISQKRPDYVMIALDHPSPAFAKLPDLISRSFGIECIGFVEGTGSASTQKLNNSRIRHKIFGLPSGPNCQRTIRRLLAERFDVKTEERSLDDANSGENANVTIRGGAGAASSEHGASGSEIQYAAATNVIRGEAAAPAPSASDVVSNGKYRFSQPSDRKTLKELTGDAGLMDGSDSDLQEILKSLGGATALEDSASEPAAVEHSATSSHTSPAAESAKAERAPAPVAAPRVVTVFERAVTEAINVFAESGPSEGEPLPLNSTGRVAVFPVDSQQWPGYIVIAMQYSDLIDETHVIESCHRELQFSLKKHGVEAKVETGLAVDLPFVDFKEWANESANFSFNPIYFSYEFGVAYFKSANVLPKAEPLEESNMFGIDVKAISTEDPVNFKAYLHLRKNQKYFLYLRSGRRLQPEQKDRLLGAQVDNLYMKSVDLENLRVFLAGNYLRNAMKKKSA